MESSIEIAKEAQRRYVEDKVRQYPINGSFKFWRPYGTVRDYIPFQDIAAYIKDTFESRFGPTWHCVVGRSFGSRVSYEMQHFILLKIKQTSVMIFKCGYQPFKIKNLPHFWIFLSIYLLSFFFFHPHFAPMNILQSKRTYKQPKPGSFIIAKQYICREVRDALEAHPTKPFSVAHFLILICAHILDGFCFFKIDFYQTYSKIQSYQLDEKIVPSQEGRRG